MSQQHRASIEFNARVLWGHTAKLTLSLVPRENLTSAGRVALETSLPGGCVYSTHTALILAQTCSLASSSLQCNRPPAVCRPTTDSSDKTVSTGSLYASLAFCFLTASVYKYVPISAMTVPTCVCRVSLFPKNTTEDPIMQTLLTTLQTP